MFDLDGGFHLVLIASLTNKSKLNYQKERQGENVDLLFSGNSTSLGLDATNLVFL